jgi:hypothetical protein
MMFFLVMGLTFGDSASCVSKSILSELLELSNFRRWVDFRLDLQENKQQI